MSNGYSIVKERSRPVGLKAQANIIEYVLMVFFIFVIIIALMLFLSSWQITEVQIGAIGDFTERSIDILGSVSSSLYMIRGSEMVPGPVLDDSKLTAFKYMHEACEKLEKIFGSNFFFDVRVFAYGEDYGSDNVECTLSNYPNCNYWSFCKDDDSYSTVYALPVNIFRKMANNNDGRTDMGILKVGVYAE